MVHSIKRLIPLTVVLASFLLSFVSFFFITTPSARSMGSIPPRKPASNWTSNQAPQISYLSSKAAKPGDIMFIYGKDFGAYQKDFSKVYFYGTEASVSSWQDSMIAVIVPSGLYTVWVRVITAWGMSNAVSFDYLPSGPPDLTVLFSPKAGYHAGQNVQIPVTTSVTGFMPMEDRVTTRLYLSRGYLPNYLLDPMLWESDIFSPTYINDFNVHGFQFHLASFAIPADIFPGDYHLIAVVDWGNNVSEVDKNNNITAIPVKISIPPDPSPVAGMTVSSQGKVAYERESLVIAPDAGKRSVSVFFSAVRSTTPSRPAAIVSYKWRLNNRPISSRIGFHRLLQPGKYQISLEVRDKGRRTSRANAWLIIDSVPINRDPYVPQDIGQFKPDGVTTITSGASIEDNAVIIKAKLLDPDGDLIMLEAELRDMADVFRGESTHQSPFFVNSGEESFIIFPGLFPRQYYEWQIRAVDSKGATSPWTRIQPYSFYPDFHVIDKEIP